MKHFKGIKKQVRTGINSLPLHYKILMWFILFSFVMLVLLWLFQTLFLNTFYRSVRAGQVEQCVESIEKNIDDDSITSLIENVAEQNDVCVYVYDTSTSVIKPLYSTDKNFMRIAFRRETVGKDEEKKDKKASPEKEDDKTEKEENYEEKGVLIFSDNGLIKGNSAYSYYEKAKKDNGCYIAYIDDEDDKNNGFLDSIQGERPPMDKLNTRGMVYTKLFSGKNDKDFMLIITSQITPVDSVVTAIKYQLITVTFVLVVIGVFFAVIASRKISRPITRTTELAHQLAKKNYDVEFDNTGYKEVTELNDTLNYAAGELRKVEKLQKELIANISHDLRTPLTMITGYGEVMRDLPGENTPENIQIIIDEANRLTMLVSDLLDISKIQSGATKLEKEVFSVTVLINDLFARYNKLKEQDGFNFIFEYSEDISVEADLSKINQVVYNLINNAINYSGKDKTVIVRQLIKDNKVVIEVEDHGDGIDQEHLENIWERYYKVDKEHKSSLVGTGLGLSIVKNILDLHCARFGVRSIVGKGSVFWFELDLYKK